MALLLREEPGGAAEIAEIATDILQQCGFVVAREGHRILAVDNSLQPPQRMSFWCGDTLTAADISTLRLQAEAEDLTGLILQPAEAEEELPPELRAFTWETFNAFFQKPWLEARLKSLQETLQPLIQFTDAFSPLYDDLYERLDEYEQRRFVDLMQKYGDLIIKGNAFMGVQFWLHYNMDEMLKYPTTMAAYIDQLAAGAVQGIAEFCQLYGLERPRVTD
jgi:hypothetical protein